ncbi:Astacin-like metalloprotease toxin 5 [Armadillidium vulgare]|nr:Astacin-like metalloprotease toxin 5 [Armadillidium vulgare]
MTFFSQRTSSVALKDVKVTRVTLKIAKRKSYRCASPVGRQTFRQELELGPFCMDMASILHELNHAIGFEHEHLRPDRGDYVEILYENIVSEDLTERRKIRRAMREFRKLTNKCIKFAVRRREKVYVNITRDEDKCISYVGWVPEKNPQELYFAPRCMYTTGVILHELMHLLGFAHEHQRRDRGAYIKIIRKNLKRNGS